MSEAGISSMQGATHYSIFNLQYSIPPPIHHSPFNHSPINPAYRRGLAVAFGVGGHSTPHRTLEMLGQYVILVNMEVRSANVSDAKAVYALICDYAEQDKMLFRSLADIYENLQSFYVAELDGSVVGCCALQIIWADLAEIKSLAVDQAHTGVGVGTAIVDSVTSRAQQLGIKKVFALTLMPEFFEKMGFNRIDTDALPMKVWSDCAKCPKQQNCDEIAVIKELTGS